LQLIKSWSTVSFPAGRAATLPLHYTYLSLQYSLSLCLSRLLHNRHYVSFLTVALLPLKWTLWRTHCLLAYIFSLSLPLSQERFQGQGRSEYCAAVNF
jgi:hypothetical protein